MDLIHRAKELAEGAGGGWLPAADANTLAAQSGLPIEQLLLDLIPLARTLAMPRLSGFQVGAVAQGDSGAIYFGANFEFEACSLNQTVHAEQATVVNAAAHGETGLARLAISAAPCGFCRQFLFELATAHRLEILLAGRPPARLVEYLPEAFGPRDLGVDGGLLGTERHKLDWLSSPAPTGETARAALQAARAAYAPYTKALAGVGLTTRGGKTFSGPYFENAAFNPSLPPMQAAMVAAALSGHASDDVAEVAIVQVEDSKIDHAQAARFVLEKTAPGATVHDLLARAA
jgi:cytidine deaminase